MIFHNKEKSTKYVIIGLIILIPSLILILSNQLSLSIIFAILFSLYLIIMGILKHKSAILSIAMGFVLLICVLIWTLVQKLPLLTLDAILYFIIAIGLIITGILVYLGYIPKKRL